jgi:hypothetical protein
VTYGGVANLYFAGTATSDPVNMRASDAASLA